MEGRWRGRQRKRWEDPGLDGFGTERCLEESRGTRGMENVGCQVVSCWWSYSTILYGSLPDQVAHVGKVACLGPQETAVSWARSPVVHATVEHSAAGLRIPDIGYPVVAISSPSAMAVSSTANSSSTAIANFSQCGFDEKLWHCWKSYATVCTTGQILSQCNINGEQCRDVP